MEDYGYCNGWKKTPEIIAKCEHEKEHKNVRRGVTEVKCEKCGFKYKIDSGD